MNARIDVLMVEEEEEDDDGGDDEEKGRKRESSPPEGDPVCVPIAMFAPRERVSRSPSNPTAEMPRTKKDPGYASGQIARASRSRRDAMIDAETRKCAAEQQNCARARHETRIPPFSKSSVAKHETSSIPTNPHSARRFRFPDLRPHPITSLWPVAPTRHSHGFNESSIVCRDKHREGGRMNVVGRARSVRPRLRRRRSGRLGQVGEMDPSPNSSSCLFFRDNPRKIPGVRYEV